MMIVGMLEHGLLHTHIHTPLYSGPKKSTLKKQTNTTALSICRRCVSRCHNQLDKLRTQNDYDFGVTVVFGDSLGDFSLSIQSRQQTIVEGGVVNAVQ